MSVDPSDLPGVPAASAEIRDELVAFVRALRRGGAEVPANAGVTAAAALGTLGLSDRERVRAGLRAALLTSPEDRALFDHLFEQFWARLQDAVASESATEEAAETDEEVQSRLQRPGDAEDARAGEGGDGAESEAVISRSVEEHDAADGAEEHETARYSPVGASETITGGTGLARFDDTEAAVGRLTEALAGLPGRRYERSAAGDRPDVRRAIRESVATGGLVTALPESRPKRSAVRGAIFVDVSRSVLDVLDRDFLVRFCRAVVADWRAARVFLFDTEVRDATAAFDADSVGAAYAALEEAEAAWGGGTRIGNAITTVRAEWPDAIDRRSVVMILSDGLEMGDVDELERGMAWLSRRAPTVLWLNPLARSPAYEPTAAGMAAALPHVDALVPCTGPEDVDQLAADLVRFRTLRAIGYRATATE